VLGFEVADEGGSLVVDLRNDGRRRDIDSTR